MKIISILPKPQKITKTLSILRFFVEVLALAGKSIKFAMSKTREKILSFCRMISNIFSGRISETSEPLL